MSCACRIFAVPALLWALLASAPGRAAALPDPLPPPTPLARWMDGLTRAAAEAGRDPAAAEAAARQALAARPGGDAAGRSLLALGAALRALGREAEAAADRSRADSLLLDRALGTRAALEAD